MAASYASRSKPPGAANQAAGVDLVKPAKTSRRLKTPKTPVTKTAAKPRGVRRVAQGDTAPRMQPGALAAFTAREAAKAAEGAHLANVQSILDSKQSGQDKAKALRALLEGASSDDLAAIRRRLRGTDQAGAKTVLGNPDAELSED